MAENKKRTGRKTRYLYIRGDGSHELFETEGGVLAEVEACEDGASAVVYRVGRCDRMHVSASLVAAE